MFSIKNKKNVFFLFFMNGKQEGKRKDIQTKPEKNQKFLAIYV